MIALITGAQKNGIRFSPEEMTMVISILKEGKSKEEQEQIENMVSMVMSYAKRK